jgi:excisionase family DNA binding protein
MASTEDRLLSFEEAAQFLSVSARWLRRAVAERRIEHVKVGRLLRFRLSALESYVEAQTREATDAAAEMPDSGAAS